MSATRRAGSKRGGGGTDFFPTPGWCVDRLLEAWQPHPGPLVEPGAGRGAIIRAFEAFKPWSWGHTWHAIEINAAAEVDLSTTEAAHVVVEIGDFLDPARAVRETVRTVIGNPPFLFAEEFVRQARRCYPNAEIVFLLRTNFLASHDRLALWSAVGVPDSYVLPERPQFSKNKHGKDGSDQADYSWFIFPTRIRTVGYLKILASTPLSIRKPKGART